MKKQILNSLVEFKENSISAKTLINEPGYRMVLLSLRAGQKVPEHSALGVVTVFGIAGHITFYEGDYPCEVRANEVVTVAERALHHLEAHEDSSVLVLVTSRADGRVAGDGDVLATGAIQTAKSTDGELDLREVPRSLRHPLVFQRFDSLRLNDAFVLINDHDPVPLRAQIESRRIGEVGWQYLERRPNLFRVRISRIAAPLPLSAENSFPTAV